MWLEKTFQDVPRWCNHANTWEAHEPGRVGHLNVCCENTRPCDTHSYPICFARPLVSTPSNIVSCTTPASRVFWTSHHDGEMVLASRVPCQMTSHLSLPPSPPLSSDAGGEDCSDCFGYVRGMSGLQTLGPGRRALNACVCGLSGCHRGDAVRHPVFGGLERAEGNSHTDCPIRQVQCWVTYG